MKATGIVRRIDDLGRVVVPKEIRRTLRIREGDPLEIFTDREGEIILKKYSPIGELSAFAGQYAESLAQTAGCLACICDMDQVVAASGAGKKDLADKYISSQLGKILSERTAVMFPDQEHTGVRIVSEQEQEYAGGIIHPVICEGDVNRYTYSLARDEKKRLTAAEQKMASCAADFLGRQMEQ